MPPFWHLNALILCVLWCPVASAQGPMERVFHYQFADEGRQLARDECKPLALHFVPDSKLGGDQLVAFYQGPKRVPDAILDKVVIVALPTEGFLQFARQLGIEDQGGYRTISAYDLGVFDQGSRPTTRSGFI